MPDPLSIAISVASLVATAAKLLNVVNSYRSQYNLQDLSAVSIKVQCDCILVALGQIQNALLSNQQISARLMCDDSFSGQSLKTVLGACELTFAVVVGRLSKLTGNIDNGALLLSPREKVERLWKESEIMDLSQNISRISDGLNLLLTAFNMKSQLEIQQVLTTSRASILLEQMVDDASSIFLSDCNASYISETVALRDQEPMMHTEIDPKDFSFDQEVLMTPAYRKVQISHPRPVPNLILGSSSRTARPIQRKPVPSAARRAAVPPQEEVQSKVPALPKTNEEQSLGSPSSQITTNSQTRESIHEFLIPLPVFPTIELASTEFDVILESGDFATSPISSNTKPDDETHETIHEVQADPRTPDHASEHSEILEEADTTENDSISSVTALAEEFQIEMVNLPKKATLWDSMPEASRSMAEDSSGEVLKLAYNRHKLYVTPTEINVSGMGLTELNEETIRMVQQTLESLFLFSNSIKTLPKSIMGCQNLVYLNLKANGLESVPEEICGIRTLKTLHLSQNAITDLPPDLANLQNLEIRDPLPSTI